MPGTNVANTRLLAFAACMTVLSPVASAADKPAAASAPPSGTDLAVKPKAGKTALLEVTVKVDDADGQVLADAKGVSLVLDGGISVGTDALGHARVVLGDGPTHHLVVTLREGACKLDLGKAQLNSGTATVLLSRKDGKGHCEWGKPT